MKLPPCPPEFREKRVALHRTGRTVAELAREIEPSEQAIRNWVAQRTPAGAAPASAAGSPSAAEREERQRLRREVRQRRVARDIPGEAAAWFARGTSTMPSGSASS
ncbi:MAG TPA: transposase [Gemmatimonadaceae bacterium]|nr:transposase [Gemmatimonadaceae bacterium]